VGAVAATGKDLDITVITRARPARSRGFKPDEIAYFAISPRQPAEAQRRARRQTRLQAPGFAGLYRTPLSPCDQPNLRADVRRVRACIERRNGVLRGIATAASGGLIPRAWAVPTSVTAWLAYVPAQPRPRPTCRRRRL
jgi:hypothetical protein